MDSKVDILYEDNYILAANKPNNVLVHHSHYARNITDDSLLQLLRKQLNIAIYPINRLDRKTSGVILLAKEKEHVSSFQKLFDEKQIEKKYLALVRGHVLDKQTIDTPVKNDRGNYKTALSLISPIRQFSVDIPVQPYPTSRYSLIEMQPITGRTHQLRIHANKIAHPIIGDHKYGNRHHNRMFEDELKHPNLFLHCKVTQFLHPFTEEKIIIEAPLPSFWNHCFDQLEKTSIQ
jgi:tRNA pseudouridine65 synthase